MKALGIQLRCGALAYHRRLYVQFPIANISKRLEARLKHTLLCKDSEAGYTPSGGLNHSISAGIGILKLSEHVSEGQPSLRGHLES